MKFKNQRADACINDLSRTLGIKIGLQESVKKTIDPARAIEIQTKEPVSHQTAIRLVLHQCGLYDYGVVFGENELTIVCGEDYQGPSLRTYSLMGRSDFSIAERKCFIQSILNEVYPATWKAANQFWIQPSESIFEVDVYRQQKVHNAIAKTMSHHDAVFSIDKDIQGLSPFGFIEQDDAGKEFDKKAAVERLRKKYAYESIAGRLKYEAGKKQNQAPKLSPAARERIQSANEQFVKTKSSSYAFSTLRSRSLQMLHEDEVEAFINRPGAGFSRMPSPSPSYLPDTLRRNLPLASNEMIQTSDDVPVSLPGTNAAATARRVSLPSEEALLGFHQNGENAFLTPQSFGYIKNRNQVAGFQSHGFSFAPQLHSHTDRPWYRREKEVWAIYRLELVSLLKHEKPAVYLSRNLPRMDKLEAAPTRPLNPFERSALKQLYEGEDVITRASLNRIEMIGSLRATKQCQQCHDVKSGTLLGAFSYELLRDPQLDPRKHRELNKPVL